MFASPLQPLDEAAATLVRADCPRLWATRVSRASTLCRHPGRSHIASVLVQNHRNNLSARVAFEVCCSCSGLGKTLPSPTLQIAAWLQKRTDPAAVAMAVFTMIIARPAGTVVSQARCLRLSASRS